MREAREEIVEYGKKLFDEKLTRGTGGNLSVFDRKKGIMAISPSGIDFHNIEKEDVVIIDLDGKIVEGKKTPSSEWMMHLLQYKNREDLSAIIHAHTMYSTVLACLRWELPATDYMLAVAGPSIKVADYASYGSQELAENAVEAMQGRKAVLLANHGILTGDKDLLNALNIVEQVEYCAEIFIHSKSIGNPIILSNNEMNKMAKKFKNYGQK